MLVTCVNNMGKERKLTEQQSNMSLIQGEKTGTVLAAQLGVEILVKGQGMQQRAWHKDQTPGNQFGLRFSWPASACSRCRIAVVDGSGKAYHTLNIPSANRAYHIFLQEANCQINIHEYNKVDNQVILISLHHKLRVLIIILDDSIFCGISRPVTNKSRQGRQPVQARSARGRQC